MPATSAQRARLLIGKAPRVDKYEGKTCVVDGCERACRALSRYCTNHAKQHFRTRCPNGRMPRRRELNPWRDRVQFAMDAYGLGSHPAIVAARRTLEEMISRPGAMPERYAKHWRRLHEGGATGDAMLSSILTVYGWRYIGLPNISHDDALFFCVLGSRFLRTVPVGWTTTRSGRVEQVRLPGMDCEVVGRALADKIGGLALLFWRRDEIEHNKRALESVSIREALELHPL